MIGLFGTFNTPFVTVIFSPDIVDSPSYYVKEN
jgi:hypothetical protein